MLETPNDSNSNDGSPSNAEMTPPMRELTLRSSLAVVGAFMAWFVTVGFLNAFGVFQDYYAQDILRDKSAFQISWIGSFANFSIFLYSFPAGFITDKFGSWIPMLFGSVAMLFAIFMLSLSTKYYQLFLTQGVLLGLGMCFVIIPPSGVIPKYFIKHRGTATGISIAGSSLGGVIWPVIFDQLFRHDEVTFGWSIRTAGFIMIPLLGIAIFTVRPPPILLKRSSHDFEQDEQDEHERSKSKDLSVLHSPPFILLCAGLFIYYLGFFAPIYYISVYAEKLGLAPDLANYLISILNGASLFGRILPGFIADRFGRFNMMIISSFTAAIVGFCWSSATSTTGITIWAAVYGFSSGAVLSLQFACATTLASEEVAGIVVGTTGTAFSLGILLGTPISGVVVNHGYLSLSIYTGTTIFLASILLLLSRLAQTRDIKAKL